MSHHNHPSHTIGIAFLLLAAAPLFRATFGNAQVKPASTAKACGTPVVLHVTKGPDGALYEFEGNQPGGYPLDAIREAVYGCKPERMLFVVVRTDSPVYGFAVPSKLQITRVRYFAENPDGSVEEYKLGHFYTRLPITPDISPEPDSDDSLHTPTKIPQTKGPQ